MAVDFSELKLGSRYNEIVYGGNFEFMNYLGQTLSDYDETVLLMAIRTALYQLENLQLDSWDEYNCAYPYALPGTTRLSGEDRRRIFSRRAALLLFLEAIEAFPWSFLDAAYLAPQQQLALFLDPDLPGVHQKEFSLELVEDPAALTVGPSYWNMDVPPDKLPTANVFDSVWETNPLEPLMVALDYLLWRPGFAGEETGGPLSPAVVADEMPDYMRWSLDFCHNLQTYPAAEPDAEAGEYLFNPNTRPDVSYHEQPIIYKVVRDTNADASGSLLDKFWTWVWNDVIVPQVSPQGVTITEGSSVARQLFSIGCDVWPLVPDSPGATNGAAPPPQTKLAISFADMTAYGTTGGCHDISVWLQSVLRTMAIPSYRVFADQTRYVMGGAGPKLLPEFADESLHGSLYLPTEDRAFRHADSVIEDENFPSSGLPGRYRWFDREFLQNCFRIRDNPLDAEEIMMAFLWQYYVRLHAAVGKYFDTEPYAKGILNYLVNNHYCASVVGGWFACTPEGITMEAFEVMLESTGLPAGWVLEDDQSQSIREMLVSKYKEDLLPFDPTDCAPTA